MVEGISCQQAVSETFKWQGIMLSNFVAEITMQDIVSSITHIELMIPKL